MITARVATLEAPRQLVFRAEQIDPGSLDAGELLAKTLVSVISPGTELAAYAGAPALRPGVGYPRLVGYCNVAEVLAAGPDSATAPGDRILTFSSHRSHFRLASSEVLAVLPSDIGSDEAAFAYLFHLGYNAVLRSGIRAGSSVVVIGLGVIGLAAVAVAALAGARVFGISEHEASRAKALESGAELCVERNGLAELLQRLENRRAQAVITTSNRWSDWRIALDCAGDQGTIAVLGFPGREESSVPFNPLDSAHFYVRQLRIVSAGLSPERPDGRGFLPFNERDNLARLIAWIRAGRLRPARLASGRWPALDLAGAYEKLLRREAALTYVLDWPGS